MDKEGISLSSSNADIVQSWRKALEEINNGRSLEQLEFLNSSSNTALNIAVKNPRLLRMREHLKARYFLYNGQDEKARDILLMALGLYGENVECLRDLACCYHQLGEMSHWRKTYSKLLSDLQRLEPQLSLETRTDCWICIGKFYEEEGHVVKALKIYREYFEFYVDEPENLRRKKILPQLVRLESQIDSQKDLGVLYSELLRTKGADLSKDLNIEVQHALMLAELQLVGPQHAWIRVENILKTQNVNLIDKSLLLFDFVEECILQGLDISDQVYLALETNVGQNLFEQELRQLVIYTEDLRLERLSLLAPELSWASYLRLLILWIRKRPPGVDAQEIKNKINLILSSFDPESRSYWLGRIRFALGQPEIRLSFDPRKRSLSSQNHSLDLSKKKGMQIVLQKLAEKPQQTIDDMIQALWQSSFTPEHYHRLRMTVHRLNRLLYEMTSVSKSIEVSSERVALRHEIKLVLSERMPETPMGELSL